MKKVTLKRLFLTLLCLVLIAATVQSLAGCQKNTADQTSSVTALGGKQTVVGAGKNSFEFSVIDGKTEKKFLVKTDKKTVGEALAEVNLIEGEDGPYGMMVTAVDGKTYNYDTDKKYWAFYENGKYAARGVESTEIKSGVEYAFKSENA